MVFPPVEQEASMITSTSLPAKYQTTFSDGVHESTSDTTPDHGGKGDGFRPTNLLEAAYACCLNTVLRIAADARGIPLAGSKVTVSLNSESPDETIFEHRIELMGDLTDEQRQALMRVIHGCNVRKTLSKKLTFRSAE